MNNNKIHPTAIIGDRVDLGSNNEILPYTVITGPTKIGDNNIIGPHVVIGRPGQNTRDPRYDASEKKIRIGNNNIIKEFTTVQKPCHGEETIIRDNTFIMHCSHIPHDCYIDDNVVVTPNVIVGGHAFVLNGANLGLAAVMHQFTVVGHYSMIGAGATLVKNIKPFVKYIPGKALRVNDYNIEKYGFMEYTDEIHKYILEGINPTSDPILKIVDEFERLHVESKRPLY